MWSIWLVFCDCSFHSICPLWIRIKSLWKLPDGRDWLRGNLDLVLMGRDMVNKSLTQFSVDGWGCVPSLLFGLRPNCWYMPPAETPGNSQTSLTQSLVGTLLLSPGFWCMQVLFVPSKSLFPQSCGSSVIKSHWPPKSNSLGVLSLFATSPGWENLLWGLELS